MTASPRRHSVPLSTVSRLVRAMSATPTLTGVIRIAADLGQRLTGLPTGVLVIDRHGVRVSAGAPVDDRYAQLFAVQSRSGPWLETFATGVAATCTYHEAQDRGWIPLATAMGYGGSVPWACADFTSRLRFPSILFRQYSARVSGKCRLHLGQACQKHPSMKTTTFCPGK